jgi:hypothetical protein
MQPEIPLERLLNQPGIGPSVIARLREVGIHSVERLREVGVDQAVLAVCEHTGQIAWANRRRPLRNAVANEGLAA